MLKIVIPSTPPPSYSEAIQNDKRKPPVEFPYSEKITAFGCAAILLFLGFMIICFISSSEFKTCSPTERLEPCEFDGNLSFAKIYALKKEINETKKKIRELTIALKYKFSAESSKFLLNKRNSCNETLEKLSEKLNYQKTHFEKCYFDNYKINHKKGTVFLRISTVLLSLIIIFCFLTSCFYLRKVPLSQLNEEETVSYKELYDATVFGFIFTFGTLCMIVTYIFVNSFEKFDEIGDIPIFVAETWEYKCHGYKSRTAEEFVSRRSYDKNFH